MTLLNEDSVSLVMEYIKTHQPPYKVYDVCDELEIKPLEAICAFLRSGLEVRNSWENGQTILFWA